MCNFLNIRFQINGLLVSEATGQLAQEIRHCRAAVVLLYSQMARASEYKGDRDIITQAVRDLAYSTTADYDHFFSHRLLPIRNEEVPALVGVAPVQILLLHLCS